MKVIRIIGRSITNAGKSIARNFSLSMASITCTIITLILVSLGVLVSYNVNNITKDIEKELTIVVFMKKETTKEELNKTKEALSKIDNVADVKYTSKDDIKNDMASEYPSFSKMMESWTDVNNPFQDSYIVSVKDVRDINETVTTIKNLDNVDIVKYSESMIGELINIFDAIKIENYSLALSYCQSFKKQNHIEEDSALMILLSNIVSKMKLLTNNKKKTDNNELPIYNDLLNIINNIAQNHDFQIIHVDNERSKEIIDNIVSDINFIEINYFNKDIMLRYKEVTNSDNLDILIKKANNAYLNKKYELAIQLYKQILSLKDELNTEYYLKISKCYNKLGKNAQAKKYLKVINLIINNDKTEEKKKSY